jgi:hypothetical protein
MKRLKAITKSYFKGAWENMPFPLLPVAWLFSPLCILLGFIFLPDFMMNVNPKDYKGTKDAN